MEHPVARTQVMQPKPAQCVCCGGQANLYNENDRDPIEGWKMASKHPCDFCQGKGFIRRDDPRYVGVVAYHAAMQEHDIRRKAEAEHRKRALQSNRKSALEKLTPAEIDALKELGL